MDVRIDTRSLPAAAQVPDLPDTAGEIGALPEAPAADWFDAVRGVAGGQGSALSNGARVLELAGDGLAPIAGGLGSIAGILNALAGIPREAVRAEAREQLRQALNIHVGNGGDSALQLAGAYARGAVLTGMSEAEMARMRGQLPGGAFDRARASIESFRREHPDAFRQLQEVYRRHLEAWQDGIAAGLLGGLPDIARGPSFVEAHRIAGGALAQNLEWAVRGRETMTRSRDDGILAVARGRVDRARLARDAGYRAGVAAAQALRREQGPAALQQRARELAVDRDRSQHASVNRPVRG